MPIREDQKIGVVAGKEPLVQGPVDGVETSRVAFVLPAESGAPLKARSLRSLSELVQFSEPGMTTTVPSVQGAALASASERPQDVAVDVAYGREHPGAVEEDFREESLIYKTTIASAAESCSEIERRPLLASRIEQAALETLLNEAHALKKRGRLEELTDPAIRLELARRLREKVAAFRAMEATYKTVESELGEEIL